MTKLVLILVALIVAASLEALPPQPQYATNRVVAYVDQTRSCAEAITDTEVEACADELVE